ncbi:MAG TPA: DNA topoisomerase VI, partial [Candidatus Aenigmarchaeota archaeon]|nr:DNA topoisomerase VI [Candidatus Aenigmarchaeota archaeon]
MEKKIPNQPRTTDPRESLKNLGADVLEQIMKLQNPKITLPIRTLSNIYFDEKHKIIRLGNKVSTRTYLNVAHTRKFMQTLLVAAECKKIIDQNVTTSIRDLYYALKRTIPGTKENTFEDQSESDPIIEDLEAALNTL